MEESVKIKLDEAKSKMAHHQEELSTIEQSLRVTSLRNRIKEIEELESLEGLWNDLEKAQKIVQEKASIETVLKDYDEVMTLKEDFDILVELALESDDTGSASEAITISTEYLKKLSLLLQKALLSGEFDSNNAIISINAGAGGTESCDWASMLYRMLIKWAEKKKFKLKLMDELSGETAGIKSVTFLVEGNYAYGLLKSETGVHRLVRISPFDSNARRHTSFASVFVSAEIDDKIEIEILDKDLRIDVYRSGGAGGQSVNTTDSAVRITHNPSGIVVACQVERSQLQNRQLAMKILRSKLHEKAMEEKRSKQNEIEAGKSDIGWGHQIRSYVLHPYKLVKDHRTNFEVSTAERVLDGDLDEFISHYLKSL